MQPSALILALLLSTSMAAQESKPAPTPPPQTPPPALVTPEVHSDDSVTFRFRAPNGQEVKLNREGAEPLPMRKDDTGIWTVNTAPLPPDYYGYSIVVDGARSIDPYNHLLKPNLLSTENMVHIPGPSSLPWELNDVPHGEIHHHSTSLPSAMTSAITTSTLLQDTILPRKPRILCSTCCTATATMPAAGLRLDVRT